MEKHFLPVREIFVVAAKNKWPVYQMDIKSTFLNDILEEEVYVDQPPGFQIRGNVISAMTSPGCIYKL
jgi:hypothetical protein